MFPKVDNIELKLPESSVKLGKAFKFDFQTGQHVLVDGKLIECDFKENIKQFIQTVLRTKLDIFKVYIEDEQENFGLSIYNYIGQKVLNKGFIFSELKREITEQLLNHRFIKEVNNFNFDFENAILNISFDCYLKNDEVLKIKEVIS